MQCSFQQQSAVLQGKREKKEALGKRGGQYILLINHKENVWIGLWKIKQKRRNKRRVEEWLKEKESKHLKMGRQKEELVTYSEGMAGFRRTGVGIHLPGL